MAHDLQLDLDVLLPDAHGDDDRCVEDLVGALRATAGVSEVHVAPVGEAGSSQVCLHVEPGQVSLRRLAGKARSIGAELSQRYGHVIWQVRGVTRPGRSSNATALLRRLPGVLDAAVAPSGAARVEFDRGVTDEGQLLAAAAEAGVSLSPATIADEADRADEAGAEHGHGGSWELVIAVGAFVVYLVARVLNWTVDDLGSVVLATYVLTAAVTGFMVGRDVVATLRARRFDIEILMFAAAIGAATIGHWDDAALLLVLFTLGHSLEGYAMRRARREIESLADLAPSTAHRRTASGDLEEVPVEALAVGDVLVVRPNERIAADGVVIVGASSVDEAPVTGESVPVDKRAIDHGAVDVAFDKVPREHRVFAGTLNGPHALEVHVARPASDSTLARVVQLVTEAETQISASQVFTQRVVRVFVPAVLVLVATLIVVPPLLGEAFSVSFLRAMTVLVAASPCALAIATPSAVLAAVGRAAKGGVLVKGGGPLEDLGRVGSIAFDKTGTLTEGRPRLVAVEPIAEITDRQLLSVALAVERLSDHPLAAAVTNDAVARHPDLPRIDATDVMSVVGKGVVGVVNGVSVGVGNAALFGGDAMPSELVRIKERLERSGATTMVVRHGEQFQGVLGVMDTPRPEAASTVRRLSDLGIRRMVMLSGDQQAVADAVAAQVGISEARGGLLPEDKVVAVRQLAAEDRHGVAMVGDGVNDAPALATANVGIAMGAAGSDVALETADVALMADRLDRLPFAVGLARRASRVIKQNLFFSLGVVAVLIPLALLGIGIGPAVIAHEGSTVVVVANALALLAHRDRRDDVARADGVDTLTSQAGRV